MNKKLTAALVILTWNEVDAITKLFPKIPFKLFDEILVVDGGSTDGTVEFCQKHNLQIKKQDKPGHGYAYRFGVEQTKSDLIVFFSGDGNEKPEDIERMLAEIRKGYDMVIASRFEKDLTSRDATFIRHVGNQLFIMAVNLLYGSNLKDVLNAFRAVRRDSFLSLNLESTGFDTEIEMTVKMIRKKYSIHHFPTQEMERLGGEAKLQTVSDGWLNLKRVIRERFR